MTQKQRLIRAAYDWQNQFNNGDIMDAHLAATHMSNLIIAMVEAEGLEERPSFSEPSWRDK